MVFWLLLFTEQINYNKIKINPVKINNNINISNKKEIKMEIIKNEERTTFLKTKINYYKR